MWRSLRHHAWPAWNASPACSEPANRRRRTAELPVAGTGTEVVVAGSSLRTAPATGCRGSGGVVADEGGCGGRVGRGAVVAAGEVVGGAVGRGDGGSGRGEDVEPGVDLAGRGARSTSRCVLARTLRMPSRASAVCRSDRSISRRVASGPVRIGSGG